MGLWIRAPLQVLKCIQEDEGRYVYAILSSF